MAAGKPITVTEAREYVAQVDRIKRERNCTLRDASQEMGFHWSKYYTCRNISKHGSSKGVRKNAQPGKKKALATKPDAVKKRKAALKRRASNAVFEQPIPVATMATPTASPGRLYAFWGSPADVMEAVRSTL